MADVIVDNENKSPKELFGLGVRAYVLQDFNSAVSALSKASELLVAEHGDDVHESLGDVYLYYGKALLGLSREENEALGDAVPRNNEEDSDEEEEEEESTPAEEDAKENDEDANDVEAEGKTEAEVADKKQENDEKTDEKKSDVPESTTNGTAKDEASGSSAPDGEAQEKCENDDEPTDLQVAWEVLELAKKIFQKLGNDGKKNLADTLTVLGEISLESENFDAAINDIKEGLEIQKQIFEKDSRTVAETYYKLGVAYATNSQIDEAVQSFNNSLEYLRNRIEHLEKIEDKKDEVEEEIKEIKSLIPDIEEKIVDMKSYKDEAVKKIVSAVTETKPQGLTSTAEASSSKPASDISHLVKRKRKIDEVTDEKESDQGQPTKKCP